MKLYHYVHCPFCIRVRMGMSFLGLKYESVVTPYDDEKTPIALTGVKMLPIVVDVKGHAQNESLEILKSLDQTDVLHWPLLQLNSEKLNSLLDRIGSPVHSLAMPYWIWTPEFNESSRKYFQNKKEVKRGPFKDLVRKHKVFAEKLDAIIEHEILHELSPFYKSDKLTIMDIMLAAHVWGMYVVPEYQFNARMHEYLMRVKEATHFNYHEDYWK